MAEGVQIRHDIARSTLVLVEIPSQSYGNEPMACPRCRVFHPVKAVHIDVDDTGSAVVSTGVLDLINKVTHRFRVVGRVPNPPTLVIQQGLSRAEVDYNNRRIAHHG